MYLGENLRWVPLDAAYRTLIRLRVPIQCLEPLHAAEHPPNRDGSAQSSPICS